MLFCLGEGKYERKGEGYQKNYRIFNQQVDKEEWRKIKNELPEIKIPLTKWIRKKDMSDEEKENNSAYKEIGGYLKRNTYEDAWKFWWEEAPQEDKDKILKCKYFDPKIFKEITSIDTTCKAPEIIRINGKKYQRLEDK